MNKEYKDTMNALRFSEEQKEKMVDRLMNTQQVQGAWTSKRRVKMKPAVAVLAAAAVLTMGAGAVYSGLASDAFASVFGGMHTEIIDKIGKPVGVSDTDAGITITADAILGDQYNLDIICVLEKEDGTPWDVDAEKMYTGYDDFSWKKFQAGSASEGGRFFDDDPKDNKIQFIYTITELKGYDSGVPMGRAELFIRDLGYENEKTGKRETLIEGEWKLRFDVQYENSSISLLKQPFEIETSAGTANITEASVSPIGFRIDGCYEKLSPAMHQKIDAFHKIDTGSDDNPTIPDEPHFIDFQTILNFKNGRTLDLQDFVFEEVNSSLFESYKSNTFVIAGTFESAIYDLSEMESITIGDITLPISAEK